MRKLVNRTIRQAAGVARIGLICFALIALLAAGASSIVRAYQPYEMTSEMAQLAEQVALGASPAEIAKEAENMDPGAQPDPEPSALLTQFVTLGGLTHDQAKARPSMAIERPWQHAAQRDDHQRAIGTIAQVDSRLAHSLTLVGSKPDGTS